VVAKSPTLRKSTVPFAQIRHGLALDRHLEPSVDEGAK
jgi:hypothetical protein